MMRVAIGSLFSGIGGLELGLECALRDGGFNVSTLWQCEADAWCRGILARHWPSAVRYDDVRAVGADAARVDILCGGFPCQDLSFAGKGAGLAGERSGLWREFARIIREIRPRVVVVENVSALLSRGLGDVLGDLAACGYDAQWLCVRASDVGAPHRRERLFIVAKRMADGASIGRGSRGRHGRESLADAGGGCEPATTVADAASVRLGVHGHEAESSREHRRPPRSVGKDGRRLSARRGRTQPCMGGDAHGLPRGMDLAAHQWPVGPGEAQHPEEPPRVTQDRTQRRQRLKALGNAVVPQVAYVVGCLVAEVLR